MSDDVAIRVDHVSKTFKLPHEKTSSIKSAAINFYRRNRTYEKQQVLNDVSFEVKKGEFFGIVGRNGSGKSTLLKLLAGIYTPSKGGIQVNGKLTPFIELGVGFNPELTGRENVFLNGALLGFNRSEMAAMYDDIVAFAELERFMDQKLKNYSSGMQVRLAFSIAIRAQGDILLLDEVLAVGDSNFQKKCYNYFKQLKKNKQTVIFVSHDSNALAEYCDRGIVVEEGKILIDGPIEECLNTYTKVLLERQDKAASAKGSNYKISKNRFGTQELVIKDLVVKTPKGTPKNVFSEADESVVITVTFEAKASLKDPIYGITLYDASGHRSFVSNNLWKHLKSGQVAKGKVVEVTWTIPNIFTNGNYTIVPAAAGSGGAEIYDQIEDEFKFQIVKEQSSTGYTNPEYEMKIHGSK